MKGFKCCWLFSLLLAGCLKLGDGGPPPRLYLLEAQVPPAAGQKVSGERRTVIAVAPVEVPAYLDRSPLVTRTGPGQIRLSPDARWGEPLEAGVRRVLAENLQRVWPAARIVPREPQVGDDSLLRLALRLERFEGGPDELARIQGDWQLLAVGSGELLAADRFLLETPWPGGEAALVERLDGLLAALSRQLLPRLQAAAARGWHPEAK